jgi:hypothetical protein
MQSLLSWVLVNNDEREVSANVSGGRDACIQLLLAAWLASGYLEHRHEIEDRLNTAS